MFQQPLANGFGAVHAGQCTASYPPARTVAGRPFLRGQAGIQRFLLQQQRARAQGSGLVVSCSALKRAYRDVLREGDPALRFVHLDGPRAVLERRMQRPGHFMPPSLLDSQLATLQPLQPDEAGIVLDIRQPLPVLLEQILQAP